MVGIYAIISPSKRIYIGQSIDNIKARWKMHKQCRKSGCSLLNNSIKKYGFDSHELKVLHELPKDVSQEVINEYELFYWQQYKDCGFRMLNLMIPGNSSKHSEETKRKISEAGKGNKRAVGYKHTDETKKRISETSTGKKYPNRKVSDAAKGKIISEETRQKMSTTLKGVPKTDEHKKKIGLGQLGNKRSPEAIANMRKARWGK